MKHVYFIALILTFSCGIAKASEIVNDVSRLNPITVASVATPKTSEEVETLVRTHRGGISIGGARHSMGGQIGCSNSLHLDMRKMNQITNFSPTEKTITVQPGTTWRQIQEKIDPSGLAVKTMQTFSNFTVGGSLSVNVHGRYVGQAPIVSSVRSIKVVLPSGTIVEASPTENSEIFYGAIGGYGGLGVIVEATLDLAENDKVQRKAQVMPIKDYQKYFESSVQGSPAVFLNADIYPPNYDKVVAIAWNKTEKPVTIPDRLVPAYKEKDWLRKMKDRAVIFGLTDMPFGSEIREKLIDPARLKFSPVVYRNYEASYDTRWLEPKSREKATFVLQEYFVPMNKLEDFTAKMAKVFKDHGPNIANVSIRHTKKDPGTLLAWAKEDSFSLVIYFKQGTSPQEKDKVAKWTHELIDASLSVGGSYYLPYQIVGTEEQFKKAYPRADEFFALKKKLDPEYKFCSPLWNKYYRPETVNSSEPATRSNTAQ